MANPLQARSLFTASAQYICLALALRPTKDVYRKSLSVVKQASCAAPEMLCSRTLQAIDPVGVMYWYLCVRMFGRCLRMCMVDKRWARPWLNCF